MNGGFTSEHVHQIILFRPSYKQRRCCFRLKFDASGSSRWNFHLMAFKSRLVYYQARFGVANLRTKKIHRVGNRHKIKTCLQISCANGPEDSIDIYLNKDLQFLQSHPVTWMQTQLDNHISQQVRHVLCRMKKSSPKTGSALSRMVSEGFTKIQAESAERVRGIINQLNRCVKH